MIVVDIGCHPHGTEESIYKLQREYKPDVIFGFDPYPALLPGEELRGTTRIYRSRMAAWTHDGFVPFHIDDPICAGVGMVTSERGLVPCFNLPAWLKALPMPEVEVILKMDCEGSEYPLTRAIVEQDIDLLLKRAVIEYHSEALSHGHFDKKPARLRCTVEDWSAW